ncbi:hypothetical protein ACQ4PT_013775 [Festuca glaucescens]
MAASSCCPSALALSTTSRVSLAKLPSPCLFHLNSADFLLGYLLQVAGLPLLLALRRTPALAGTRAAASHGAACSWSPLWPELAVLPRAGAAHARGRAHLLRPRAWLTTPQIASTAFTVGTVAVLPFYTLMIAAPNADITKRTVESTAPYVALGLLYAYLLYLSWTPDTIRAMFASKYWLPELPGIVRMFASEMTVASAWIHLLVVDLFAARQVYHDGIKNNIETRHSISLCLLFCPVGIAAHALTKNVQTCSSDN